MKRLLFGCLLIAAVNAPGDKMDDALETIARNWANVGYVCGALDQAVDDRPAMAGRLAKDLAYCATITKRFKIERIGASK